MANPTKLSWSGPTSYTDGTAFGQADLAGFRISVDGKPSVDIPVTWNVNNAYEFPLSSLTLSYGTHSATMQTVAKNGGVSVASAAISFTLIDERVPNPPKALSVS
jgi:hypothetical protein